MDDGLQQGDGIAGKHGAARALAEQAVAAQARGDEDEADRLFAEADKADPDAVIAVLQERGGDRAGRRTDMAPQDDDEIAAMSRTVEPGSDTPSRAGVSGSGSGADSQGT
jgi:hypothetical protein